MEGEAWRNTKDGTKFACADSPSVVWWLATGWRRFFARQEVLRPLRGPRANRPIMEGAESVLSRIQRRHFRGSLPIADPATASFVPRDSADSARRFALRNATWYIRHGYADAQLRNDCMMQMPQTGRMPQLPATSQRRLETSRRKVTRGDTAESRMII